MRRVAKGMATRAVAALTASRTVATNSKLPGLDAEIEGQQRQWHIGLRQADFLERTGEAEAVQQTEGKSHQPRIALRHARRPGASGAREFTCDEGDAQRDRRLDRRLRQAEITERCACERDAVGDSERGDRLQSSPAVADEQHQRQYEQQVVETEQDMFDAEHEIGLRHLQRALRSGDRQAWRLGGQAGNLHRAIVMGQAHQHICQARAQPVDRQAVAFQAADAARRQTLEMGALLEGVDRLPVRAARLRQTHVQPEPHLTERRGFPDDGKVAGRGFTNVEIGRAQFMGARRRARPSGTRQHSSARRRLTAFLSGGAATPACVSMRTR